MQYLNTLKGTFIRVSQCFYVYFSRSSSQMKALKAIICKCFSSFHAYLNLLKCNLPGYWHVAHPWKTFFHLVLPEYIIWMKIPFCVHLNGFRRDLKKKMNLFKQYCDNLFRFGFQKCISIQRNIHKNKSVFLTERREFMQTGFFTTISSISSDGRNGNNVSNML